MDVEKVIELLNKAFADEWLAYYQYWVGAKVAVGPMREAVAMELEEHATEELSHALLLVNRITQLGGTPVLTPEDWYKKTNCGYETPDDPSTRTLVNQNIEGEQCAIEVYQKLLGILEGKDPITYNIVLQILQDEVEHEEDLQGILEDMDMMEKR
jgi:bacterioferritin